MKCMLRVDPSKKEPQESRETICLGKNDFTIDLRKILSAEKVMYELNNNLVLRIPRKVHEEEKDALYERMYSSITSGPMLTFYAIALDFCLENKIGKVVDIGCSLGLQSLLFNQYNISYIGVDTKNCFFPYRMGNQEAGFLVKSFPFDFDKYNIRTSESCFISSLCAFWIVDASRKQQMQSIENFGSAVINVPTSDANFIVNSEKIQFGHRALLDFSKISSIIALRK